MDNGEQSRRSDICEPDASYRRTGTTNIPNGPLIPITLWVSENGPTRDKIALLDTGANRTFIAPEIAAELEELGAEKAEVRDSQAAGGPVQQSQGYKIILELPNFPPFRWTVYSLQMSREAYRCIIGRDLLQHFTLTYKGREGEFILEK